MCNCVILDVTVKKILITAFLKKLPFLAKGLLSMSGLIYLECIYQDRTSSFRDYYYYNAFITRHTSGLKTCSEALTNIQYRIV